MRFFHYTHPYFFAHHHIHRRRIECVRNAGIPADGLTVVPDELWDQHESRYTDPEICSHVQSLRCGDIRTAHAILRRFLARQLFINKRVIVHVLRQDPGPVLSLKSIPFLGKRLRVIIEHEGDVPSQLLYENTVRTHLQQDTDCVSNDLQTRITQSMTSQTSEIAQADGLVLMSDEHIDLWKERMGNALPGAVSLPPLGPQPAFSQEARHRLRTSLGFDDKFVVVYTGNVVCSWQRFEETCNFIATLARTISNLQFLAVVRLDDVILAENIIEKAGLGRRGHVTSVAHEEVADFLSAADAGLFLRHQHRMNKVVASAKLCEYLASGLPVISTGANSEFANRFLRDRGHAVFIRDTLPVDAEISTMIAGLAAISPTERDKYALQAFTGMGGTTALDNYSRMIQSLASR
ncbi:MAG: hypothetical protein ABGZ35_29370 [Planctomycetaceae bacterium]